MNEYDDLDLRKKLILKAVIDDYISSVEPVGSRTIAKRYDMGLSSATIRNEMADLEEMGYLVQPHASAGRIPSEKGYRFYVDKIINSDETETEEIANVTTFMNQKVRELNQLIKTASEVVARMTQYTAIAMTGAEDQHKIKAVQIVPVENGRAIVVLVANDDVVKNKIIDIDLSISPEMLIKLSSIINSMLAGCSVENINVIMINELSELTGIKREYLLPIMDGIIESIKQCDVAEVYTEGTSKLLTHPEFNDVSKARNLLELMQKDDCLVQLLTDCSDSDGLVVKIGSENSLDEITDCSLITATYTVKGVKLGTIGVLGPTRMDYKKVISALEYVRKKIKEQT